MKPSTIELGFMLKVDLKEGNLKSSEIFTAKEWQVIWKHTSIRFNHEAYYLMCFFLEVILKTSTQDDLHDKNREFDTGPEGIFRVLSNAIFYLEDSVVNKRFSSSTHLSLFTIKLIFELGITPQTDECIFCKKELKSLSEIFLIPSHGGFSCSDCMDTKVNEDSEHMPGGGRDLCQMFEMISHLKYPDYHQIKNSAKELNPVLLNYFLYQTGIYKKDLKTISFVL